MSRFNRSRSALAVAAPAVLGANPIPPGSSPLRRALFDHPPWLTRKVSDLSRMERDDARSAHVKHAIAEGNELGQGPFRSRLLGDPVPVVKPIARTARQDEINHVLLKRDWNA